MKKIVLILILIEVPISCVDDKIVELQKENHHLRTELMELKKRKMYDELVKERNSDPVNQEIEAEIESDIRAEQAREDLENSAPSQYEYNR